MSKVSKYLNEHILGEVVSADVVRDKFSHDGSILSVTPELVINPRTTNDIRKVARFTWQLAEKGHVMPITVRGGGSDQTGAAIGKGIIINTVAHLNNIIYINLKDKDQFIHVQPGVNFGTINETLKSHGLFLPTYPTSAAFSTIGGAVANNAGGILSGRYGRTGDKVNRLEVILANGDLIETSRISKHELNKKKGLQTLEGEIYRKIDGLIEDNQEIIDSQLSKKPLENTGYSGIAKVKNRDGSFDLTPLFIGSQGTLGIISELVMNTDFYSCDESVFVATFTKPEDARDAADIIATFKPAILELLDNGIFDAARTEGKQYIFDKSEVGSDISTVLYASFNDFNIKQQHHKIKHIIKKLSKFETRILTSNEYPIEELKMIREIGSAIIQPEAKESSAPSLIDGASIPSERREEFVNAVGELAAKHHIELPLHFYWLNGVVHTRTPLQLHTISDKQKVFKLISDYYELVNKVGGSMITESAEGRLKTVGTYNQLDDDIISLYKDIKLVFDPFGTLNPGVKQPTEIKTLVSELNPSFNIADFIKYSPQA